MRWFVTNCDKALPACDRPAERTTMSRDKGRAGLKLLDREFPHHVDMMLPEGGFVRHAQVARCLWHSRCLWSEPAREHTRHHSLLLCRLGNGRAIPKRI